MSRHVPLALLILVLTLAAYWRAALAFFAIDDFVYLQIPWEFWSSTADFFLYPKGLAHSVFRAERALYGARPVLFHVFPFVLHLGNAWMVYRLIRWALPTVAAAAPVATVLFTLSPSAYTPMAWLSQGHETVPCLTFTLATTLLFIRHIEGRTLVALPLALVTMTLALAFKTNAVLAPVYLVALGGLFIVRATPGHRTRAAVRVAASLVPFAVCAAWFALIVVGSLPHFNSGAYARDFSPAALWGSYRTLLPQALNPLPIFRERIGYQEPVPASFVRPFDLAIYQAVCAALACAIGWLAVRRGHTAFFAAMVFIVVGGLGFAAPLTRHLQDYYPYFVAPAASGLLSLPVGVAAGRRWKDARAVPAAMAFALVVYAAVFGTVMHATNYAVRQGEGARAVDEFVRTLIPGDEVVFARPNWAAAADTVNWGSIRALQPQSTVVGRFPNPDERQAVVRSSGSTHLVALDTVAGRAPRIYRLDPAQWQDRGRGPMLEYGNRVIQPFTVASDGLIEVHVRLSRLMADCEIDARVFEISNNAESGQESRLAVGGGRFRCEDDGFQVVPVEGPRASAGRKFVLELAASGRSAISLFHVAPVPPDLEPLVEVGRDGTPVSSSAEPKVLAFRAVVTPRRQPR